MAKNTNSNWAVPTQKLLTNNNKNMKVFGTPVAKMAKKTSKKVPFNPGKFERARKNVFGMR